MPHFSRYPYRSPVSAMSKNLHKLIAFFIFSLCALPAFSQQFESFYLRTTDTESIKNLASASFVARLECPFLLEEMQTTYVLELSETMTLEALKKELEPIIKYSILEPVPQYQLCYTPNDIQSQQYNLAIINAAQAWDINFNGASVVIAITDDAVDLTHSDLAANIWVNPNEIPNNGIDDDGNSFVDDMNGWDFGDGDNNPNPNTAATNHGTHVGGIAAASTDNGNGIAAISANSKIMAVKMSQTGSMGLFSPAESIDYSIAMGADVINMSWGGGMYTQIMQDLFNIAYAQNVVCIAASGNSNVPMAFYPANYDHVIAVASTDQMDQKSGFSNYGADIDVSAPGTDIYSTVPGSQYMTMSGTSMASPLVSGLVGLMKSANPLASVDDILNCLVTTCDPVNGAFSGQMGGGRINAFEAMQCITTPSAVFDANLTQVCPGNSVQFNNYSSGSGLSFAWSFPGGTPASSTLQNPVITYNTPGVYDVSLTISNGTANFTSTVQNYIAVAQPQATISGNSSIIQGGFGSVIINFTGNAPFDFTISDGTNSYPITGITNNPYIHYFNPTTTSNYTIASFSDSQCLGLSSGSGTINVAPSTGLLCDTTNISMIKYLGTTFDDACASVQEIGQYGYLVIGSKNIGASSVRSYICRLDKCGNILWEKTYNESFFNLATSAELDGNEILVSLYNATGTTSNNSRTVLLRLDLNGNVINSKEIIPSSSTVYPRKMFKTSGGDYVFAGVTNQSSGSFGGNDCYLLKCDANGAIIWKNRYGANNNDFCHNAIEDSNGDFISVGYQRNYFPFWSGYISKHDANGNLLWMRRYDISGAETSFSYVVELNGMYYVSGRIENGPLGGQDITLLKVDPNGNIIWQKYIGGSGEDYGGGIDVLNDTIYLQALTSAGASSIENAIMRFSDSGNLIDYGAFGTSNNEYTRGLGTPFKITSDEAIIGVNHSNGNYLGGDDIFFFRYKYFSDLCDSSYINPIIVNGTLQSTIVNASQNSPSWTFTNSTFTQHDVISNQGFACVNPNYVDSCELIADFNFSGVYCPGDSLVFTNTSTAVTGNADIGIWDFGDGSSPSFSTSPSTVHFYQNSGSYAVTLIVADTILGCSDTLTQMINLVAQPTLNLIDSVMICPGDSISITANANCLSSNASVDWFNDSILVNENGLSVVVSANTSQYVYVEIIDGPNVLLDSVYIQMDANCCSSNAVITTSAAASCIDSPITIEQVSNVSGVTPQFNWQFLPDGNPSSFSGAVPPAVIFPTSGMKTIILELTDDCGTFYDTVQIIIAPNPAFDMGNSDILCASDTVQFGEPSIAGFAYSWQPSAIFDDPTIGNPSAYIDAATTVSVTVIDTWTGCQTVDSIAIQFDSVFFDITMNDTLFCGNSINVPFDGTANLDVNWTPSSVISEYFGNDSITVQFTDSLLLIGTITSTSGYCSVSDTVVLISENPLVPIYIDTTSCEEETFLYIPEGDWTQFGVPKPFIQLLQEGIYFYEESSSCGDVTHQITLALESCECEIYLPNTFSPDGDELNPIFQVVTDCELSDFEFLIFNRWGEVIFESSSINEGWDGTYLGKHVQDGTYTWRISYTPSFDGIQKSTIGHVNVLR